MSMRDAVARRTGLRLTPEANQSLKVLAMAHGLTKEEYLEQLIRRQMQAEGFRLRMGGLHALAAHR